VLVRSRERERVFYLPCSSAPSPRNLFTKIISFIKAFKSNSPFDYVIHTASPFHFDVRDPAKDLLDPAIKGTTGILKAVKAYAPTVKRVVITSSFAAIMSPTTPPEIYDETSWNPVTLEEAYDPSQPATTYRASKVRHLPTGGLFGFCL
jgi:nucleoside-diphosphate-sugar epimerase